MRGPGAHFAAGRNFWALSALRVGCASRVDLNVGVLTVFRSSYSPSDSILCVQDFSRVYSPRCPKADPHSARTQHERDPTVNCDRRKFKTWRLDWGFAEVDTQSEADNVPSRRAVMNRLRPRFSLLTLLLLLTILILGFSHLVTSYELSSTRRELLGFRYQYGVLVVDDATRPHVLRYANLENPWKWHINLPVDQPYKLTCGVGSVPRSGVPNAADLRNVQETWLTGDGRRGRSSFRCLRQTRIRGSFRLAATDRKQSRSSSPRTKSSRVRSSTYLRLVFANRT